MYTDKSTALRASFTGPHQFRRALPALTPLGVEMAIYGVMSYIRM